MAGKGTSAGKGLVRVPPGKRRARGMVSVCAEVI
jgi:hypothetical protein